MGRVKINQTRYRENMWKKISMLMLLVECIIWYDEHHNTKIPLKNIYVSVHYWTCGCAPGVVNPIPCDAQLM